jgi:hypothetical protein
LTPPTPARKFCSRCGTSLETAALVKTKWWKKLIPKRKVKTLEVGERPGVGGVKGKKVRKPMGAKVRRYIGFIGIGLAAAFALIGPFRTWVQDNVFQPVKDKYHDITTQSFEPVAALNPTATSEEPGFPIIQAFDLVSNSAWHGPFTNSQIVMTVQFQQPTDIDRALVTNGDFDNFAGFSRPRNIHLVFDTGQTFDFELKDSPDAESYDINNGAGVSSVQIFIVDTYQSTNSPTVAVTEWEWKTEE